MIVLKILNGDKDDGKKTLVEDADPVAYAQTKAELDANARNWDWLRANWGGFLPDARGKYVVVANQQGAVVETMEEADAWLKANHPDDISPVIQYVLPYDGVKIYANRG